MSNEFSTERPEPSDKEKIQATIYTMHLLELNQRAQRALRDFALQDFDDKEELERKRIAMHDAFTELYDQLATFNEQVMGVDFDIAYLRERIAHAEGETKESLEKALSELEDELQRNLAEIWMARVLAWLHQAAAASGPFTDEDDEEREKRALQHLATVYTMLEKSFTAAPGKADGTEKLRRVALGQMVIKLLSESLEADKSRLAEIEGKNKAAEAEFYDEFLNELITHESMFRQAFNPFDELIWRDILFTHIYERATDLYNEAIPKLESSGRVQKEDVDKIRAWKANTAGLSEVYLGMMYNDIANAQMRAGNLEDASKLYQSASDAFARAEKCFSDVVALAGNARQARSDKEHNKAQSLFCRAESAVETFIQLLRVDNREEAKAVLEGIFKDLRQAEKLSKTRELTGAIRENLRIFSFVEDKIDREDVPSSSILDQIDMAKGIRREGLIQDINKSLDIAVKAMQSEPADALEALREGLTSLGILLSLETEDDEVRRLRHRTLAIMAHLRYVVQFQMSAQLGSGVKFLVSRILERLHAEEAAEHYRSIGMDDTATELVDMGRLALATACASEAQIFAKQSDQWAFRAQMERIGTFRRMADEIQLDVDEDVQETLAAHDNTIERLRQAVAAFEAAADELGRVADQTIRANNKVELQVRQLQGVVMKFKGDLKRLEAAKANFLAEYASKKGDKSKARSLFSEASDQLREAVGAYTTAARVFQEVGNLQAAQSVDKRAKTTDLLARSTWDNKQRLSRDEDPNYFGDPELSALYLGSVE